MNLKTLKILVLTLFVGGLVFTACQDKFSEEDFLNKQYALDTARTNKQIKALNDAGELLSFTVQVVEDNNPLAGVLVKMSNAVGSTGLTAEATTDANGQAIFQKVKIGGNTLILSKTGYVTASATVVFPDPTTGNGNYIVDAKTSAVIPIKLARSARLPLFSNSATATASTAVIKGKVTIETDLTNTTPELPPAPVQIKANFAAAAAFTTPVNAGGGTTGVTVANYVFTEGTLGIATTDASGNYSITVPALSDGLAVTLDVPTIEGNQRVAVNKLNGVNITPEYRQVPTSWTPGVVTTGGTNAIPTVVGAVITFPAPPAPGRGLTFGFTAVPRALETGTVDVTEKTLSNTIYHLTNRGSGFTSSPTVAITQTGATSPTVTSAIQGTVSQINVASGGVGYPAGTVDIHYVYTYLDGTATTIEADFSPAMVISGVPVTAGVIQTGNLTLPNSAGFSPNATLFKTPIAPGALATQITGFKIRVTNPGVFTLATNTTSATITPTVSNELSSFTITNGGSGFTSASAIAVAITGGGGSGATASVVEFQNQFDIALSGPATTPYKVLPAGFTFVYPNTATNNSVAEAPAKVDRRSLTGVLTNVNLLASVTTDGTNIMTIAPYNTLRTTKFWAAAPTVVVLDATNTQAAATPTFGTGVNLGKITTITVDAPGAGYDTKFAATVAPSIVGAPGTGATIDILAGQSVNTTTKIVSWNSAFTLTNQGSGYLANLNQTNNNADFSPASTSTTVKVGNTVVIDIRYGTGLRREVLN